MIDKISSIRKYNYWDGQQIDSGFPRTFYMEKIGLSIGNQLVKVLVGQRRAGKSYLLRQIASKLIRDGVKKENVLYLNREYLELNFLQTYTELESLYQDYRKTLEPVGKVYLLIDEIQYVEGWERFVNSHSQDFAEPCELFISGSNSTLLSGELATLLSGRYVKFEVLPFSYSEYCGMTGQESGKNSFIKFLQTGALPELFNLPDDEVKRNSCPSSSTCPMMR